MITSINIIRHIAENDEVDIEFIVKYADQQEKVNELLKEHIQLSYDFEYMLVHGIKDDMKYTKTANRLLTVREKITRDFKLEIGEGELNDW